ncbi:terpene synthase family protein (plasmid) [Streptosporangium sp. CA-135522]|uniref:terpene synthase family protein n=1 Tax=Streptosporangium sp. CA-135522 TaxID=3240072 RepID=UPI003D8F65F2
MITGCADQGGIQLPELRCPWPVQVSPYAHEVDAGTLAWLRRFEAAPADEIERCRRAAYGQLAGRVYPHATRPLLQLMSDWCTWLFVFDDVVCEGEISTVELALLIPRLYRLLDGDVAAIVTGSDRALLDLRTRIAQIASREQLNRWTHATRHYLASQTWEAANREAKIVPSLADYLIMRRHTGAVHTVHALIDLATGLRLKDEEWASPLLTQVSRHAVDVVDWDNDLLSWVKEHDSGKGDTSHNLVTVVEHAHQCSRAEAVQQVMAMREAAVEQVRVLGDELTRSGSAAVGAYVAGLRSWITGAVDYALTSVRYAAGGLAVAEPPH